MTRPRVFWFHFNRPQTLAAGAARWSVHFAGTCHVVARIDCRVPCASKARPTQPRAVMRGHARSVSVTAGTAVIE